MKPRRHQAILTAALVLSATTAARAQGVPHPCNGLGQAYAVKWCVSHESALMDSVYAAAAAAAVAAYPAAQRDSVAASERNWLDQHTRAVNAETDPLQQFSRNLVGKRRRLFRLRHQILSLAAGSDPDRMRVIPVYQEWSATQSNRGLVLTLTNSTPAPIEFLARLYDPMSDRLDERPLRILARASIRISWIEGWEWQPGMALQLLHPDYAPQLNEAAVPARR